MQYTSTKCEYMSMHYSHKLPWLFAAVFKLFLLEAGESFYRGYCHVKMIRGRKANQRVEETADVLQRVKHPLRPVFMSTSQQIEQQGIAAYYSMYISLLALNTQIKSSFILPCAALVLLSTSHCPTFTSPPPAVSLEGLPACQEGGWRSWWGYPVKDFT